MTPLDFFDQKELKDRGKTAVTHSRRRLKSYTRQNWVGCSKFIGAKGFELDSDRKSCLHGFWTLENENGRKQPF